MTRPVPLTGYIARPDGANGFTLYAYGTAFAKVIPNFGGTWEVIPYAFNAKRDRAEPTGVAISVECGRDAAFAWAKKWNARERTAR